MAKDTQLITPLEKLNKLGSFEGAQIVATGIEIPGAGGGLHDALIVDPVVLHQGEEVYVLIKGTVRNIKFPEVPETGGSVKRVHVLKVEDAAIIDESLALEHLEKQRLMIEEQLGIRRLEFDAQEREDAASDAHEKGEHAEERDLDDCPECQREAEAEAAEAEQS